MKQASVEYWSNNENRDKVSQRSKTYWNTLTPNEYKETCKKRKESACRPETVAKKRHIGEKNGMYGRTHSWEVKEKLSRLAKERLTGKTYEEIHGKEKAAILKKQRSESTKGAREKTDYSGNNNPHAKSVVVRGIRFETSSEAAKHFGKSRSTISEWLRKYEDCYFL